MGLKNWKNKSEQRANIRTRIYGKYEISDNICSTALRIKSKNKEEEELL